MQRADMNLGNPLQKIASWLEKNLVYQFGMMRGTVRSRIFQTSEEEK